MGAVRSFVKSERISALFSNPECDATGLSSLPSLRGAFRLSRQECGETSNDAANPVSAVASDLASDVAYKRVGARSARTRSIAPGSPGHGDRAG
jgi:hypothetical protein